MVLEEKPDPVWTWIVFKREVVADGPIRIAGDHLFHGSNIPRKSRYRGDIFVNADTIAGLILWRRLL